MVSVKIVENIEQLIDHYLIRKEVFVLEQNISLDEEYDFIEKERVIFLIYYKRKPIGTARVKLDNFKTKIERVAILKEYRNKHLGKMLMDHIIQYCISNGFHNLFLSSQEYAIEFYEKCGFKVFGDKFMDANIPHYNMKYIIP